MTSRIPPLAIHPWGRYWLTRALLALLTLPSLAHAVACGDVLVGGTHTLTADLDCSAHEFFAVVLRDGAVLDLGGHTIISGSFQSEGGIILDGTGSVLKNGSIQGLDVPVFVAGVGSHTVQGVTILNDAFFAVHVVSDRNTIRQVSVPSALAAFVLEGDRNTFRQSHSEGADRAIHVYGQKNIVDQNTTGFNLGGLFVPGSRNVLTRNHMTVGGGFEGVLVQGAGNLIARNTATGYDVDGKDANGNCTTNRWRKNTFATADPACILSPFAPVMTRPPAGLPRPRPDYVTLCAAAKAFFSDEGQRFTRCAAYK